MSADRTTQTADARDERIETLRGIIVGAAMSGASQQFTAAGLTALESLVAEVARLEAALAEIGQEIVAFHECICDEDSICLLHRVQHLLPAGSGGAEEQTP